MIRLPQQESERCGAVSLWGKVSALFFSLLLILSNATLYGRYEHLQEAIPIAILSLCILSILAKLARAGIPLADLKHELIWFLSCAVVCFVVSLGSLKLPTLGHFAFLLLYSIFPLFILLHYRSGTIGKFFDYLSLIIAWLALSSSILWFAGPFLGVLKPNCSFPDTWSNVGATSEEAAGYYGLLYQLQWSGLGSFLGYRNTSIFGEGPAFAFYLLVALLIELFYFHQLKKWRVCSFLVASATSFSTTSWIIAPIMLVVYFCRKATISKRAKTLIFFISICLLCAAASVAHILFTSKVSTSSGAMHMDDYQAGFEAWLTSPIIGGGIGNNDAIVPFMSSFRANNTGFSNTFLFVLATGGLLYFVLWLVPFLGYYRSGNDTRWFGFFLFLIIGVSNVSYFAFAAFFLGYGIALLALHPTKMNLRPRKNMGHMREI